MDTLITYVQLFAIGISLGIAGPCLLSCTPIASAYIGRRTRSFGDMFLSVIIFMLGRLSAYLMLGIIAGLSGYALRQFTSSGLSVLFRPIAGVITLVFALIVIVQKNALDCPGKAGPLERIGQGGLFLFGMSIGLVPCAPLTAVLFDIALMSRGPIDGLFYALSFGAGTFISGSLAVIVFSGIIKFIPSRVLTSCRSSSIFKLVCAALLVMLGIRLILP